MAVAIVDVLEIIHVHGDQRQRLAETLCALTGQWQRLVQAITVGDPRQGVGFGKPAVLVELDLQLMVDP
ncbi:hypothetical protein D3C76_1271460 [compost metagenome]